MKYTLCESKIRLVVVIYLIFAIAIINGLLSSAVMLAETHGEILIGERLFVLAFILRFFGLVVLLLLIGIGPTKQVALRIIAYGYISGMCTAFVSGYLLFYYAVITRNQSTILTHDFLPFWRIIFAGVVTAVVAVALKSFCSLLGFLNELPVELNSQTSR